MSGTDLISRQAAIDALDQIFDRCEEIEAHLPEGDPDRTGYKMYPDYMTVWKYLHQLPTIEPERKKGKWIVYEAPDRDHCGMVKCPFCGECMIAEPDEYNYFPDCGADLREQP